jgi:hypothetical protein
MNDSHISSDGFTRKKRGRPKKIYADGELPVKKVGLPLVFAPTEYDLKEELSMLESYTYARYN